MDVSIIVCTYNRAESLRHTLDCLAALTSPPGLSWEVLIVDNNSGDHTREMVAGYSLSSAEIRYLFEKQQGLSYARNKAINSARGDILLFTDDDVCPEPDWLERVVSGMSKYQCDACGGYIAPVWETPPPAWLTERFYGFLAIKTTDKGACQILEQEDAPFGANMAFRKSVFEQLGQFDVSRGRKGAVLSSGEDWEMFERILNAGMKVMYLPDARVHHRVEASRMSKRYFRRWRYQTSYNIAQSCGLPGSRHFLGIPLYLFRQFFRACWAALVARLTRPEDEAFNQVMIVCHFMGTMHGLYNQHKTGAA